MNSPGVSVRYLLLFVSIGCLSLVSGTNLHVTNNCSTTVCAKYWSPKNGVGGGCSELGHGASWDVTATPAWSGAIMWAIAGVCAGQACNTGPPTGVTQFEISVDEASSLEYYGISVLAGFNLAMRVTPTNSACPGVECTGQTASQCPNGFYPGNPYDETKNCSYGSTNYDLNYCV